jgi:hypothetical protein
MKTEKERQNADGRWGRGWVRSQITRRRECPVLYKSLKTLFGGIFYSLGWGREGRVSKSCSALSGEPTYYTYRREVANDCLLYTQKNSLLVTWKFLQLPSISQASRRLRGFSSPVSFRSSACFIQGPNTSGKNMDDYRGPGPEHLR